ncbi:MAG: hypothetical protein CTY39_00810, partial [Hyphomicrobium sp.]
MQQPEVLADPQSKFTPPRPSWRDAAITRALHKTFGAETRGRLEVVLPSGHRIMLGSGHEAPGRV